MFVGNAWRPADLAIVADQAIQNLTLLCTLTGVFTICPTLCDGCNSEKDIRVH